MGFLSALGPIFKFASKIFGYVMIKKAVQADAMKEQLDDIRISNEVKRKVRTSSASINRNKLRKHLRK